MLKNTFKTCTLLMCASTLFIGTAALAHTATTYRTTRANDGNYNVNVSVQVRGDGTTHTVDGDHAHPQGVDVNAAVGHGLNANTLTGNLKGALQVGGDFSIQYLDTSNNKGDILSLSPGPTGTGPFTGIENTSSAAFAGVINYYVDRHFAVGMMLSYMDVDWDRNLALNNLGEMYKYGGFTVFHALHFTATWLFCSQMLAKYPVNFYFTAGIGPAWAETSKVNVYLEGTVDTIPPATIGQYYTTNHHHGGASFSWFTDIGAMVHLTRQLALQLGVRYTDWGKYTLATTSDLNPNPSFPLASKVRARFYGIAPFVGLMYNFCP